MPDAPTRTREVARAAVRSDLSRIALELFIREGFDSVTINDVAAFAGVSRSTFMRYFETKEDAVFAAFQARGEDLARALRERPSGEHAWVALRRAMDSIVDKYRHDPVGELSIARLIRRTPALRARGLERECAWRPLLAEVLNDREEPAHLPALGRLVLAAAALDCLDIAVDHWATTGGQLDLGELLDAAFKAISAS
jgi:AcrR family transcriptional regulator